MDKSKGNYTIFVLLVFMLSLLPKAGFSLGVGFGAIKLSSYLNEPLDAEIVLENVEDTNTNHLIATLASVEDFKHIELARPYFLSTLRFEVVQRNKQTILKVTSEEPVKQTYLEFLVQLTWPGGRVVRDYTLLLDPAPVGEISKHAANEQVPQTVNKADNVEESVASKTSVSFQDPAAILSLQEKSIQEENIASSTEIAEAKNIVGVTDASSGIIVDKQVPRLPPTTQSKSVEPLEFTPAISSKSTFSKKQLLLSGSLGLLLVVILIVLTTWFLRRRRSNASTLYDSSMNIMENTVVFNEEIKLKLNLAKQYIAYQDIQNAKDILEEVISQGNAEEIKLAKGILKKINH